MEKLMLGTFGGQNTMAKSKDADLPPEVRTQLSIPIDLAMHRFVAKVGNFSDWVDVTFRILVGKYLAINFYPKDIHPRYEEALKILNQVHTRNITVHEKQPRLKNWDMTLEEYAPLFDRLGEIIDMHDQVHRKHLLPIYKKANTDVNIERALFDANFPETKEDQHAHEGLQQEAVAQA